MDNEVVVTGSSNRTCTNTITGTSNCSLQSTATSTGTNKRIRAPAPEWVCACFLFSVFRAPAAVQARTCVPTNHSSGLQWAVRARESVTTIEMLDAAVHARECVSKSTVLDSSQHCAHAKTSHQSKCWTRQCTPAKASHTNKSNNNNSNLNYILNR